MPCITGATTTITDSIKYKYNWFKKRPIRLHIVEFR